MRSWVVALLLLPAVHAEPQVGIHNDPGPAETTLFLHGVAGRELVLNVQEPEPESTLGGSSAVGTLTQRCVAPVPGLPGGEHHTWYAFATPGYVWYEDERVQYDPVRGIADDLRLAPDQPVRLVWYLEGNLHEEASPLPAPDVVVRATLREGDQVSPRHGEPNNGRVIAQGETEPALLAGAATPDHPQVRYVPTQVDGETRHVYEFSLELPYEGESRVPADVGFNLRVDAFIENPACTDTEGRLMPQTFSLHSSDGLRPRFTWGVLDPIRIAWLAPEFVGDDLVIHAQAHSPWGRYDIGEQTADGMTLTIEGPATPERLDRVEHTAYRHHHNNGLDMGRSISWVWDLTAEEAPEGLYVVHLTVENHQGTARSTAVAAFEVGSGSVVACRQLPDGPRCATEAAAPSQESPGISPLVGLLLLGALAAVRRR